MAVVCHRVEIITLVRVCQAPVMKRIGIAWIDPQALIIVLDRAVIIALICVCQPSAIESRRVSCIESQGLVVVLDSTVIIAFMLVRPAAPVECQSKVDHRLFAGLDECSATSDHLLG